MWGVMPEGGRRGRAVGRGLVWAGAPRGGEGGRAGRGLRVLPYPVNSSSGAPEMGPRSPGRSRRGVPEGASGDPGQKGVGGDAPEPSGSLTAGEGAGEGPGGRRAEAAERGLGGERLLPQKCSYGPDRAALNRDPHFILLLNFIYLFIFFLWLGLLAWVRLLNLFLQWHQC